MRPITAIRQNAHERRARGTEFRANMLVWSVLWVKRRRWKGYGVMVVPHDLRQTLKEMKAWKPHTADTSLHFTMCGELSLRLLNTINCSRQAFITAVRIAVRGSVACGGRGADWSLE